ncbi:MAG: isochorismatase family protein [Rhodocyclaceae bacterium]|nr:isochorismatase family protein [Rhodocyclaceae bacterium]MDP1957575.1 isochorismatase family protein [Rhodocyclaceae bacterium]
MKPTQLMRADQSALLVIDLQERLLPHVHDWQQVLAHVDWLVRVAERLGVPVAATEQYPKGIGHTHPQIAARLSAGATGEKIHFSCVAGNCLPGLPGMERPQVVVCGIEAHVCVLQTVLELAAMGKQVFVVAEAVGSRDPAHKALALERMRSHGATIVCREMVAFEWLGQAGTEQFRDISKNFLK